MQILRVLPANPPSANRSIPSHTETASRETRDKDAVEPQPASMDMAMDMEKAHGGSQR
jgi:hypothetical protein